MLDEDTHMCPAFVDISCSDCIIGTTVNVEIILQEKQNVIVVPFESIVIKDAVPYAYIVKDNKANLVPLTLGIRNQKQIEVISGLNEGDKIILYGHERLYSGAPISISH